MSSDQHINPLTETNVSADDQDSSSLQAAQEQANTNLDTLQSTEINAITTYSVGFPEYTHDTQQKVIQTIIAQQRAKVANATTAGEATAAYTEAQTILSGLSAAKTNAIKTIQAEIKTAISQLPADGRWNGYSSASLFQGIGLNQEGDYLSMLVDLAQSKDEIDNILSTKSLMDQATTIDQQADPRLDATAAKQYTQTLFQLISTQTQEEINRSVLFDSSTKQLMLQAGQNLFNSALSIDPANYTNNMDQYYGAVWGKLLDYTSQIRGEYQAEVQIKAAVNAAISRVKADTSLTANQVSAKLTALATVEQQLLAANYSSASYTAYAKTANSVDSAIQKAENTQVAPTPENPSSNNNSANNQTSDTSSASQNTAANNSTQKQGTTVAKTDSGSQLPKAAIHAVQQSSNWIIASVAAALFGGSVWLSKRNKKN
ncbi:hypothetical protein [Fructobacillus pseudoficulneus]|nr:hypothetical protein [Fructobacillus pseudoficulneus]